MESPATRHLLSPLMSFPKPNLAESSPFEDQWGPRDLLQIVDQVESFLHVLVGSVELMNTLACLQTYDIIYTCPRPI